MKTTSMFLTVFATVLTIAGTVHADDQDFNAGLKQELDSGSADAYPKRPKQNQAAAPVEVQNVRVQNIQPAPAAPAPVQVQPATAQVQPIYILQQPQAAPVAQVEPTTTVEAAAVKESRIEQLRRQREEVEHQTEDKLMQRLEDDRLVSEKDRSDRIFNQPAASPAPAVAPVAVYAAPMPAPVAAVAVQVPPPTVVQSVSTVPATESVTTQVDNTVNLDTEDNKTKFSVGGLAGIGSYPTVSNVSGQYALGVSGNFLFNGGFGLEVAGLFSSYRVTDSNVGIAYPFGGGAYITQMNQTNVTTGLTYHLLEGRVSPVVGVLAGYTRRSYSNLVNFGYGNGGYGNGSGTTTGSNAFDGGAMVGVDIAATKKLTIGADFRYMMNLSYATDAPLAYYGNAFGTPLEGLSYYFATLSLKLAL